MKKKMTVVGLIAMFLLTSFSAFVVADRESNCNQVTIIYSFEMPFIRNIEIGSSIYDQVVMQDSPCGGNPGEPQLPVRGAYILLPQGSKVNGITVTPGEMVYLGSDFMVEPVGESIPLSQMSSASSPIPDERIYNSADLFPGKFFTEIGTYCLRGYEILVLTLYPVQYVPVTGELFYYPDLTVSVETALDNNINLLFRGLEKDKLEVMEKVDNPEVADTYTQKLSGMVSMDDYDLLIITTDALKDDFEPLKNAHNANGVSTVIKTLSDIDGSTPEDIRDYIRDAYNNWSVEYVLLGGDNDTIAVRKLYVSISWYTRFIPSDLYYACLDGTYNYDGDDKWGEPTDGENGSDVDLIAEVYVGRACVDNSGDVSNFVNKTITYMDTQWGKDEYLKESLMVGEKLGSDIWGGDRKDLIINGSSAYGHFTVGLQRREYNVSALYDRDWPGNNWSKSELLQYFDNDTLHIINYVGHSWYDYNMKLNIADVQALTNNNYLFVYSTGCQAGGFDNESIDCIAEHFTVKTEHGAFAGIWNTREGWYKTFIPNGMSIRYDREFWDAICGEDKWELGKANQDSKEDNLYRINEEFMRTPYYGINLFGDPAVKMKISDDFPNSAPEKPDTPDGSIIGDPGVEYEYSSSTTDLDGDPLFYNFSWGDGAYSGWIGRYKSGGTVSASYSWNVSGSYEVKVRAKDIYGLESEWSDSLIVAIGIGAPPDKPAITGHINGKTGTEYEYTFKASDPDGDDICYFVDWGDDTTTGWTEFAASGTQVSLNHTWTEKGTYNISAKAKDVYDLQSDWGILEITMPKNQQTGNMWLLRFLERFPRMFPMLRQLLGLM